MNVLFCFVYLFCFVFLFCFFVFFCFVFFFFFWLQWIWLVVGGGDVGWMWWL